MRLGKRERQAKKEKAIELLRFIENKHNVDEKFNIDTSTKNPKFWNMLNGRVMQNYKGSIIKENFGKCVFGSNRA